MKKFSVRISFVVRFSVFEPPFRKIISPFKKLRTVQGNSLLTPFKEGLREMLTLSERELAGRAANSLGKSKQGAEAFLKGH